jgi:hypothetical protein
MYLGLSPALYRRQRADDVRYDVVDVSRRPLTQLFYWLKRRLLTA